MASWHELPSPKTAHELGEYFSDYLAAVDANREVCGHDPAYTSEGEWLPDASVTEWDRRKPVPVTEQRSWIPREEETVETESSEPCEMVYDGTDTNGDVWNRCTVHNRLVLGDAYVCEGYVPAPYPAQESDGA